MKRMLFVMATVLLTVGSFWTPALAGSTTADTGETRSMSDTGNQQSEAAKAAVEANPADVKSMDAILAALYDVISGPAGKKRDWDREKGRLMRAKG